MSAQIDDLLELGLYAGTLLLESGAEVYRIEDTVHRMLIACGAKTVDSIVTPTGIYISVKANGQTGTRIRRIKQRTTNLSRVSAINALSRSLGTAARAPELVVLELQQIEEECRGYSTQTQLLAAAVGGGAFASLFGAIGWDIPIASVVSVAVLAGVIFLGRMGIPRLLADFAGGFSAAFLTLTISLALPEMHYDRVILGAIMSLVPGVLLTTAVRDMLSGDLMSGTTRMSEALFIAAAIAAGVGAVLGWWIRWINWGI